MTHLLLVLPPRASRSAASRGPARARWSARRYTGSSLNADDREPASSLRPRTLSRWPTPPQSIFSLAGLRLSAGATRADEPRSTARVCEGCMLCHRAEVKAGQPAASTSSRMEVAFLCCCGLVYMPLLYGSSFSPEGCLRALLSPYLFLSIVLFIRVTWCGVYIIFSQKTASSLTLQSPCLVWSEGSYIVG